MFSGNLSAPLKLIPKNSKFSNSQILSEIFSKKYDLVNSNLLRFLHWEISLGISLIPHLDASSSVMDFKYPIPDISPIYMGTKILPE